MRRSPAIHPLTSLRFFAAVAVVLYHVSGYFLPTRPFPAFVNDVIDVGFSGVSFFFLLSGFILAFNYLGPPDAAQPIVAALHGDARRSFFVARIARIYPLFLVAFAVIAPFVAAHRFDSDASVTVALGKLTLSLGASVGLVQAWHTGLGGGWNPPSWTLSTEAFFYLVFPWLGPRIWRSKLRDGTLLAALYAAALAVPVAHALVERWSHFGLVSAEGISMFPPLRLPEFLFGVVLARVHLRAQAKGGYRGFLRRPAALWAPGLLGVAAIIALHDRIDGTIFRNGILAPALALVILGFSSGESGAHRVLCHRWLVRLGEASYGVYILHIPVFFCFAYLVRPGARLTENPALYGVDAPLHFLAYLSVLLAASIAALALVEEPARRWIRDRSRRVRPIQPSTS